MGNCYDNAVSESFFARFKDELGDTFPSRAQGRLDTFECIEVHFNRQRRHSYNGNLTRLEAERFYAQHGRRPDGLDDVLAHSTATRVSQDRTPPPAPSLVIPSAPRYSLGAQECLRPPH